MKRVHESVDFIKHRDRKQLCSVTEQLEKVGLESDSLVDAVHDAQLAGFRTAHDDAGNKFTSYVVHVIAGQTVWEVPRRYNDFKRLHERLAARQVPGLPPLPPKRIIGMFSRDFLERRRSDLEQYLRALLSDTTLLGMPEMRRFLWADHVMLTHGKLSPSNKAGSSSSAGQGTRGGSSGSVSVGTPVPGSGARMEQRQMAEDPRVEESHNLHMQEVGSILDMDGGSFYSPLNSPRLGSGSEAEQRSSGHSSAEDDNMRQEDIFPPRDNEQPDVLGLRKPPLPPRAQSAVRKPKLDDFEMVRVLGKGSFGKVMLCRKRDDGKLYAMKVLKKQHVIKRKQVAHTRTERSVLGQVDHPFVVKLHYAFQTGDKLHFVLDFCSGGELFFHLGRAGRFSEALGRFYSAEIALALGHLHAKGVVYRDLKPENILLDSEGHIKLADFGLSKEGIIESVKGTHSFCGTPEYLAPEVLNRTGHGSAVDWWSLGALLYEMLTGLPPWYSQDRKRMFASIRSSELRFPDYISAMARLILTDFLERDVTTRLGSNGDIEQVQQHPFFANVEWDRLYHRQLPSPFVPSVKSQTDTGNFDTQFTRMPINSIDAAAVLSSSPQPRTAMASSISSERGLFDGFTFVEPSNLVHHMNRAKKAAATPSSPTLRASLYDQ